MEGQTLLEGIEEIDRKRLVDASARCSDRWIENKHYSPDRAEKFRAEAREKLYAAEKGGKN
jgi:hypothetical protein